VVHQTHHLWTVQKRTRLKPRKTFDKFPPGRWPTDGDLPHVRH
jgi:hypothetical protein